MLSLKTANGITRNAQPFNLQRDCRELSNPQLAEPQPSNQGTNEPMSEATSQKHCLFAVPMVSS